MPLAASADRRGAAKGLVAGEQRLRGDGSARWRANNVWGVPGRPGGGGAGQAPARDYALAGRWYARLAPAGRALFLADTTDESPRAWPVVGNSPAELADPSGVEARENSVTI